MMRLQPSRHRFLAALAFLLPAQSALAFPPGSPMSEFGPRQVALGLFFDHSGQSLFEDAYPSVVNQSGASLDYAPWPYLQIGFFAGAAEFDVALPESRLADTAAHSFNSGWSFSGGGSLKLATPRFLSHTTRFVAYGAAGLVDNEDAVGNKKRGMLLNAGGTFQCILRDRVNFVLGAEFYALNEGEQESAQGGDPVLFGITAASPAEYARGVVGVEYFFKGRNRPFVSLAFRPTGVLGWHDELGLQGGSISVTFGAVASIPGKGASQPVDEEEPQVEEE